MKKGKKGKKKGNTGLYIFLASVPVFGTVAYFLFSAKEETTATATAPKDEKIPETANIRTTTTQTAPVTQPPTLASKWDTLKNTLWHDRQQRASGGTPLYKWAKNVQENGVVEHIHGPAWTGKLSADGNKIEWTNATMAPNGGWFWYRQPGS